MISELHRARLPLKYGINPDDDKVQEIISSVDKTEAQKLLDREDVGGGLLFRYPQNGAFRLRLDEPIPAGEGKTAKYLSRAGEPNALFNPGVEIETAEEVIITEGELKALSGYLKGLPVVALSGIWSWRTTTADSELLLVGDRLRDDEALLPELQRDFTGKKIALLYDSDIGSDHIAFDAFPRLAEQLYRLGAEEVRVITLPSVLSEGKTGLDDFIIAKEEEAPDLLRKIIDRAPLYIPIRDGAETFADRLLTSENPDDLILGTALLLIKKEEFSTRDRLESLGMSKKKIDILIRDAKKEAKKLDTNKYNPPKIDLGEEFGEAKALLIDPDYTIDDKGRLCRLKQTASKSAIAFIEEPLCNFVAWPVREIVKDDGLIQEKYIEIKGVKEGHRFPTAIVSMSSFGSMSWVPENWGAQANIYPNRGDILRHCIQTMVSPGMPQSYVYTHLGWRKIGDYWVYLHVGGAIGTDNAEVEINPRLASYALPQDDDEDPVEALKASLDLLKIGKEDIVYPLLALVYLAPLCDPLKRAGREPGFVSFIAGPTGTFKSTIAALFLSHYGKFGAKGLPASFRDTALSIEMMAFMAKDTILAIDDLYPPQNPREKRRLESTLEYLSRSQGDRQGRGRLDSSIRLRMGNPPRGLPLCTGEEMNLGPGSSYYRLLILPIKEGDVNLASLTKAQENVSLLAYAMRGYLEFIAPQMEEAPRNLLEDFDEFRMDAAKSSMAEDKHRRLYEVVAHLTLGFISLARYAVEVGVWDKETAKNEISKAFKIFVKITDAQVETTSETDPVNRFFNGLWELLGAGKIFIANMDGTSPEDSPPGATTVGWGPDGDGIVYLSFDIALEKVKTLYRGAEEPLLTTKNALLNQMEERGIVTRNDENERSILKKIDGKNRRVVPVPESYIFGEDYD